jgi:hypothetical protein
MLRRGMGAMNLFFTALLLSLGSPVVLPSTGAAAGTESALQCTRQPLHSGAYGMAAAGNLSSWRAQLLRTAIAHAAEAEDSVAKAPQTTPLVSLLAGAIVHVSTPCGVRTLQLLHDHEGLQSCT